MSDGANDRDNADQDGKTRHDIFLAAEELRALLHSMGLQTGREFPTASAINDKIDELKSLNCQNHAMLAAYIHTEVNY